MWVKSDREVDKGDGIPEYFSGFSSEDDPFLSNSHIQPVEEAQHYCGTGLTISHIYEYPQASIEKEVGKDLT